MGMGLRFEQDRHIVTMGFRKMGIGSLLQGPLTVLPKANLHISWKVNSYLHLDIIWPSITNIE
jgi:hypothetical protein